MKKKQLSSGAWTYIRTGLIVLGCLVLVGAVYMASKVHDVTISQKEMQEKIDAKLPLTTKNGVIISQADVTMTDALTVNTVVSAKKFGQGISGEVIATLHLKYRDGKFFMVPSEMHIKRLTINSLDVAQQADRSIKAVVGSQGIDEEIKRPEETKGLKGSVGRFLRKKHTSLKSGEQRGLASSAIQKKAEELIVASASKALTRIPVYQLPNSIKGSAIKMMVKDVEIKDGSMIVYLSFWQLGLTVLLFLGLFVGIITLTICFPAFFEVVGAVAEVASVFDC